jgi:hypothetical protein
MYIREIHPGNKSQIQQFLSLPDLIYREIPQWVPNLSSDLAGIFNRRANPFYRHSQAAFFLATDSNNIPIGRLAVINNRNYNQFNQENTAFFFLFESMNDLSIAQALFTVGEKWAKNQGLDQMLGPKGFTSLDGLGLLTKGFGHRPAFGIPYNPSYYPVLLEEVGFERATEIVSGYLNAHVEFPEKIHKISALVQQRRGLTIVRFKNRRDLRRLVPKLQQLYNGTLDGTSGNTPLTDDEAKTMANQILWFADPRLIKIVMKDKEPVGFLFAYPDISAAVQRTHGQIFPFGWMYMLQEMHKTNWVNINGAGIIEKYRGLGGTAILFSEMQKSIIEGGFDHAELVQIGTENDKMQLELRDLGVDFYKTHTIFRKVLS